jgi:hypothetical protein
VPLEEEGVLLGRIIHAVFLSPRTIDYIQRIGLVRNPRFIHAIGRDRRNMNAIREAVQRGETHYQGKPIQGSKHHPHVMRWPRRQVLRVLREVTALSDNLYEVEDMIGLPTHTYKDDATSVIEW